MSRYLLSIFFLFGTAALGTPESGTSTQPAPEPALDAQWAQHHVDFHFFGHTGDQHIYYNCDAVESKIERLLRMAGARKDMKVRAYCAEGPERVSALIRVELDFKSPTLAPQPVAVQAGESPPAAAARWQPVSLRLGGTQGFDQGDCVLLDQLRMQVLKVFDLRNLTMDMPCSVRFGPPRGRTSLAFEALTATPTAEAEGIQFEKQPKKHDDKLKSERS